jgi:GNAT superfamily N-acetyltransferase
VSVEIKPLSAETWPDLVALFSRRGAGSPRRCWCMYYRRRTQDGSPENNRRALRRLVRGGEVPGLLAYEDGVVVGWVSLAPRERFPRLERSPVMKRIDDEPVWSIVCFFVDTAARGRGVADSLLNGAVEYARSGGARILEAYPTAQRTTDAPSWFGGKWSFERAGFKEVARPSQTRSVMRRRLRQGR